MKSSQSWMASRHAWCTWWWHGFQANFIHGFLDSFFSTTLITDIVYGFLSSSVCPFLLVKMMQVRVLYGEKRLHEMVDRDLRGSFNAAELENSVEVVLLCTQSNPGLRPKMSEVVKTLEAGVQPGENTEESNGEPLYGRSCSFSRSYDDNEASSFIIEPIELSGPRW